MSVKFKKGWDTEIRKYAKKYGTYQAFLDCFTEDSIRDALADAQGKFDDTAVKRFLALASSDSDHVTVEQGPHQPEDMQGGGFCLHFTGRDSTGKAFHFYITQRNDASLVVFEITYLGRSGILSNYRR